MSGPDFLIIGAQRAGTTWLADMIRQHPEVCMPKTKEIHFFNKVYNFEKELGWYEGQFSECEDMKVCGEATPNYLWTSSSLEEIEESNRVRNIPEKVHAAYPNVKLIVSLREPVDRAVSAYRTLIRGGHISPRSSIVEVAHRHGIITMGDYETHIRRWFEYFPPSQFLFLIFEEDIKRNREVSLRRTYQFLGVDPSFIPSGSDERKHPSLGPFYRTLIYYLPWLKSVVKRILPNLRRDRLPFRTSFSGQEVSAEEREQLRKHLDDFNKHLPNLIGRKPNWWSGTEEPSSH